MIPAVSSKREIWRGVDSIPETVDGYDWAPFKYAYRCYYWRGIRIWRKRLASRQLDQYTLIKWAFPL